MAEFHKVTLKNIFKRHILNGLYIIAIMALCSSAVFAQEPIPNGKWMLDTKNILITDGNGSPVSVTIENLGIELYTEIEIHNNSITLKSANKTIQTIYENSEDEGIIFESPEVPFDGGSISDKLYFHQFKKHNNKEVRIIYTYEPKKK